MIALAAIELQFGFLISLYYPTMSGGVLLYTMVL